MQRKEKRLKKLIRYYLKFNKKQRALIQSNDIFVVEKMKDSNTIDLTVCNKTSHLRLHETLSSQYTSCRYNFVCYCHGVKPWKWQRYHQKCLNKKSGYLSQTSH